MNCFHQEKHWVVKFPNGHYFYQPNQGQLITGDYLHAAYKYKSPKHALKNFTKVLNYVDGGHAVVYTLVQVNHKHIYDELEDV